MKNKIMFGIAMLIFISLAFNVAAIDVCPSDLSVALTPTAFIQNTATSKIEINIAPPGAPGNSWLNYDNATLSLNTTELLNKTVLFKDLTNPIAQSTETWNIQGLLIGTFDFNVTFVNSSGDSCKLTSSVVVGPNTEPDLNVIVEDWQSVIIGQATSFTSKINNTGNGTAYDVVKQFTDDVATQNIQVGNVDNVTAHISTDYLNATICGLNRAITVSAKNYHNGNKIPMTIISTTDNFDVFGSDLNVITLNPSDSNPNAGDTIVLNASIKNLANTAFSYNATGTNSVDFYYNDYLDSSKKIDTVTLNNSLLFKNGTQNISTNWSVPGAGGSYTIYAVLSTQYECDSTNNVKQASISAIGCVESWSCSAWSESSCGTRTCTDANVCGSVVNKPAVSASCDSDSTGGTSSGSSSGSNSLQKINFDTIKKVTKQLKNGAKVEFTVNGKVHTLTVDKLGKDFIEVTVKSKTFNFELYTGQTEKIDFEADGIYDLELKLIEITNYAAKTSFEKISEEYDLPDATGNSDSDSDGIIDSSDDTTDSGDNDDDTASDSDDADDSADKITGGFIGSGDVNFRALTLMFVIVVLLTLMYLFRSAIVGFFTEDVKVSKKKK